MRICIAQTQSIKGNVQKNIQNHLRIIEHAIALNADLIVFPELSITGYEPELAKELATIAEDSIFLPFQEVADSSGIAIGIGMPTNSIDGVHISMLIFEPNKNVVVYSKQMLHDDELPFFTAGSHQAILTIKGSKIAFGICYETLQREHFVNACKKGTDIYIASVAKPQGGVDKAYAHFPTMATEFGIPILMSNCVGYCDSFLSVGQSAVWNTKGIMLKQLDDKNEGLLLYDTAIDAVEVFQPMIVKGRIAELEQVFQIFLEAKSELERNGIFQWTNKYPSRAIIESDLNNEFLYILRQGEEIIGAVNISEQQESEYDAVKWAFDSSKVLVVHRLVVKPAYQGKGFAKQLMDFAEDFAKRNGYTSIRLDTYSKNNRSIDFYKKRNYVASGEVNFPERAFPFYCMEKEVQGSLSGPEIC